MVSNIILSLKDGFLPLKAYNVLQTYHKKKKEAFTTCPFGKLPLFVFAIASMYFSMYLFADFTLTPQAHILWNQIPAFLPFQWYEVRVCSLLFQ